MRLIQLVAEIDKSLLTAHRVSLVCDVEQFIFVSPKCHFALSWKSGAFEISFSRNDMNFSSSVVIISGDDNRGLGDDIEV